MKIINEKDSVGAYLLDNIITICFIIFVLSLKTTYTNSIKKIFKK